MSSRILLALALAAGPASAHAPAHEAASDVPLVASSERPFQELMDESMARMHAGMEGAPRTGDPDRDFVTQMIPHHQGAVDMARIVLVHGRDPALRQLAKEIIADQQNEIQVMRQWLAAHPAPARTSTKEQP